MIRVAVVGMKHSGSTMLYNMLREILTRSGYTDAKHSHSHSTDKDTPEDNDVSSTTTTKQFQLFKTHDTTEFILSEERKISILLTVRDVRDTSISGFLRFIFQQSIMSEKERQNVNWSKEVLRHGLNSFFRNMHENIRYFRKWNMHNPYVFVYERYKSDPIPQLKKLVEYLNIQDVTDNILQEAYDAVESYFEKKELCSNLEEYRLMNPGSEYLATKDHNTSGGQIGKYETFFTVQQHDIILEDDIVRTFLEEMDYPV